MNRRRLSIKVYVQILLLLVVVASLGCSKGKKQELTEDVQKLIDTESVELKLELTSPMTVDDVNVDKVKVSAKVTPEDEVKMVEVVINDTDRLAFNSFPLSMQLPAKYARKLPLKLSVTATAFGGKTTTITKEITNSTPQNPQSGLEAKNGGVLDPDCMAKSDYDACIFWKSPVAMKKAKFNPIYSPGESVLAPYQTFGIKLGNLTNFKNTSIDIYGPRSTGASGSMTYKKSGPLNGSWKVKYENDANEKRISQIMAWFWLNHLIDHMKTKVGKFYAEAKNIKIFAFDDEPGNTSLSSNAYWDSSSNSIHIGYIGTKKREVANGADVYIHEMGHANLQYAAGAKLNQGLRDTHTFSSRGVFCKTATGCLGGINEGQADFHTFFIFEGHSKLGEDFVNDPNGFANRDASKYLATTAEVIASRSGEVHAMGSVYSAILWKIYSDASVAKTDFGILFNEHLPLLAGNTTFAGARDAMISVDTLKFNGKYAGTIKAAFKSRGIN